MIKKRKLNVLFFLNSLGFGGAEKQSIDLINNINRDLFGIGVAYLNQNEALLPELIMEDILCVECLHRSGKFDFAVLGRLKRLVQLYKIDTVICINEYAFLYAYFCKIIFRLNFRLIAAIHHTIARPGVWEFVKGELYRHLLNRCDIVLFVCKNQLEYWIEKYQIKRSKTRYIYNGIDISKYSDTLSLFDKKSLQERLGFSKSDFVVGICAVLRPEKKHKDFLEAIQIANSQDAEIKGLIIGDGPEHRSIEQYISENRLNDEVVMVGFQSDVRPYLSICDCIVLTSHAVETFSIAVLEAMAMGKPVVMTNIGGASEQITPNYNGFLFEKGDITGLAQLLVQIKKNNLTQQMGEKASQVVQDNFSMPTMINSYEQLLSDSYKK